VITIFDVMDWDTIETFLKDTVWGVIILGALGSGLLLLILNVVGRANKGLKYLWIFYKQGRNEMSNKLKSDSIYLESIKFVSNSVAIAFLTFLIISSMLMHFRGTYYMVLAALGLISAVILINVWYYMFTLIIKAYRTRMK
jgi:hypothetical protein